MRFRLVLVLTLAALAGHAKADELPRFRFESVRTLEEMHQFVRTTFRTGSAKLQLRRLFVEQGDATMIEHPTVANVEKYIYDINLCDVYIWRWNISADFGDGGDLRQIYVNGEAMLDDSAQDALAPKPDKNDPSTTVYKGSRPRPEAFRGESTLSFILLDADGDLTTTYDQMLAGGGPSRADPNDLGKMHASVVIPWRSIFDSDEARTIVPFEGQCPATP